MSGNRADVIVVGAGIMGASAAWHCARRGLKTVVLEQFDVSHLRGSSHGAARIFRFAYSDPVYVRLAQRALPLWREIEQQVGASLLLTTGGVDIGPWSELEGVEAALLACGETSERIGSGDAKKRFPAFRIPDGWEMLYQQDTGVLRADACRLALLELAVREGASVHPGVKVKRLEPRDSSVLVQTTADAWEADRTIVAAASWSNRLLAPLGMAVPLRVTREHVAFYPIRPTNSFLPFIWHGSHSTFEYYGLPNGDQNECKVGQHGAGPETDPDLEGVIESARVDVLTRFVEEYLPVVVPSPTSAETCLYAATPDDDFVIEAGRGIVVGAGFGGHGFKFASLVGEMLADLVSGTDCDVPARFSRARFAA